MDETTNSRLLEQLDAGGERLVSGFLATKTLSERVQLLCGAVEDACACTVCALAMARWKHLCLAVFDQDEAQNNTEASMAIRCAGMAIRIYDKHSVLWGDKPTMAAMKEQLFGAVVDCWAQFGKDHDAANGLLGVIIKRVCAWDETQFIAVFKRRLEGGAGGKKKVESATLLAAYLACTRETYPANCPAPLIVSVARWLFITWMGTNMPTLFLATKAVGPLLLLSLSDLDALQDFHTLSGYVEQLAQGRAALSKEEKKK